MKKKAESEAEKQLRNFVDAARESGCDEDEAAFDAKLRAIARVKPKPAGKKVEDDKGSE